MPDDSLTIRERAIAAWPTAWHGQNLRDIATTLGFDVDRPWRDLPKKDATGCSSRTSSRAVPVYPDIHAAGGSARAQTQGRARLSGDVHERQTPRAAHLRQYAKPADEGGVAQYMVSTECPLCHGKRLRPESLSVKFAGLDIADISSLPLARLSDIFRPYADGTASRMAKIEAEHPEKAVVAQRIAQDLVARLDVMLDLGLGYLAIDRSTPTLSPGELQQAAARHAGALEPVRCGLCARRAVGRASSSGYGGAAECARAAEGVREFAVRGRAQSRRDPSRRLDRRCGSGRRRAGRLRAL